MSDNLTELGLETQPDRRGFIKKVAVMAAVLVLVIAVLAIALFSDGVNLDTLRRWVKYMNVNNTSAYGEYSFDSHSSNQYSAFGDGLVIASVSGLDAYDEKGGELFTLQQQMNLP